MKLLSIIIPVYNVERYIRECLESIFRQGLSDDEFEIILVNDGTPDNSIGVVSDLIEEHDNVIVLNQNNQGVSLARNAGLTKSQGKYVYFMDPDDLLVDNALSALLLKVIESSVDILITDHYRFNDGDDYSNLIHVAQQYSGWTKTGEQAYIEDLSPYECYIWKMVIKRSFLFDNNIFFKPFGYEDTLFCQECLIHARNVIKADYYLCVYRLRSGSFTSSMNLKKMYDLNSCLSALMKMKDTEEISFKVRKKLTDNIHSSLSYGIWCITNNDTLYHERKNIISDLKAKIPASRLFFYGSIKQYLFSIMFRYFPYLYLSLRRL